ncbi:MAG: hypothetical protein JXP73_14720 [Deltaproteobacteria bacterium]|jgi:hypothetical protein|nr:hypothetical protein [Deltaproteobacteria bacterium]
MAEDLRINIYKITRGACRRLQGPCPHTMCRFNLTSERRDSRGARPTQPHFPVVRETCALEAAEHGGMTLEDIALRLSLTRERVRQIELGALKKLWARLGGDESNREEREAAPHARRPARIAA